MRLRPTLLVALAAVATAVTAGAQQPRFTLPPAQRDTTVSLDRVVAVVGDQPITQYDLQERLIALQQAPGFKAPTSEAEYKKMADDVLQQIVDEELLVQKAHQMKLEVPDADLTPGVDKQVREVRGRFQSETEFRSELAKAGLGSPEEYRRYLLDQMRRNELQRKVVDKLRNEGKIPPVNVSQAEVEEAFNKARTNLPRRPATITFRQIVINPKPGAAAKERARVKAESLLVEIKGGAEFERIAKRESADSVSAVQGGDLGWARRGIMVPEFEQWMFGLQPGQLSPVVETVHGFHIIRVDRRQLGEVKSRHILIRPVIDSTDVARARLEADTVLRKWTSGVAFDTLAKLHHDFANGEETSLLTPIARDSMPATYQKAIEGHKAGETMIFTIPSQFAYPKFVVLQILTLEDGGEYTLQDMKERVRAQLVDEGSYRRFLDGLRKEVYVRIRLDQPTPAPTPPSQP